MIIITKKTANNIAKGIADNVSLSMRNGGYILKLNDYNKLYLSVLKLLKGEKK